MDDVTELPTTTPERLAVLGRAFHDQLTALGEDTHDEDLGHDIAVGHALWTAIAECDVTRAVDDYNAWATQHGFATIMHRGTFRHQNGQRLFEIDIQSAIIVVNEQCDVFVKEQ